MKCFTKTLSEGSHVLNRVSGHSAFGYTGPPCEPVSGIWSSQNEYGLTFRFFLTPIIED